MCLTQVLDGLEMMNRKWNSFLIRFSFLLATFYTYSPFSSIGDAHTSAAPLARDLGPGRVQRSISHIPRARAATATYIGAGTPVVPDRH